MNSQRIRTLSLPRRLDLNAAEDLVKALSIEEPASGEFLLNLAECTRIDIGAGYRLGNALRRFSDAPNMRIILEESRSDTTPPLSELVRSGLAVALLTHASRIFIRGTDVTGEVKPKLQDAIDHVQDNSKYIYEVHRPSIPIDDLTLFSSEFNKHLLQVGVAKSIFERAELVPLTHLCFEAVQNVADHAGRRPLPPHTRITSYLSIRAYPSVRGPSVGAFTGYLKRVHAAPARFSTKPLFLELVINDDGVGIPGRQVLDPHIYFGPYDREQDALAGALAAGGSVKLVAKDTVVRGGKTGEGTTNIHEALRSLGAYATLRTGRLAAVFDGLAQHYTGFRLAPGPQRLAFGFMPGTAFQIVVPLSE
jgi:hypothetical protein